MQNISVTIGMPVYNRPLLLKRAIQAVLRQTHKNIEIVVSNNCSPDGGVDAVVKEQMKTDARIRYYYQQTALPVIDNFLFVLEKARGEYFMWLADDDWIDDDYIEKCLFFLTANKEYSLACGQCMYHNTAGELTEQCSMPSIESSDAFARVSDYYKSVTLNGYFFGLKKTALGRQVTWQNKIGSDWLYLAAIAYRGKMKVMENTFLHISSGGMSNDVAEMNRNMGANNFFTRNFTGLTISANAAADIFKRNAYPESLFSKFTFAVRIFFTVWAKTFIWDVLHIKRFLLGSTRKKK
jgi:glycosyltransferase domain-containing protein